MKTGSKKIVHLLIGLLFGILIITSCNSVDNEVEYKNKYWYTTSKPYIRWWWFASKIKKQDVKHQLNWLKENKFGGVEIAWIYPYNRDSTAERYRWLGDDWSAIVAYTKNYADSIGLGCDFTFGTGWPFGDSYVQFDDANKKFRETKTDHKQAWNFWEFPNNGYIIDHLNKNALKRYGQRMGDALQPALTGTTSGLFCDSWEVPSYKIWTDGFGEQFQETFGYDISAYMDSIYSSDYGDFRYDYLKLVSEYVINRFYKPFTGICHDFNAFSRVQCMGAPADIITAYSCIDVPETEAMLYDPSYSRIVASAAALASKPIVSCETFTCIYGFPDHFHKMEQTADLKMVADALFANGVNHIIWHGKPYNPVGSDSMQFYATVHVGKTSKFANELPDFNRYMAKVSDVMRQGVTYSDIAVYLPLEDSWMAGVYPEGKKIPGSWIQYEMRYVKPNYELRGYHPLWINADFLKKCQLKNGSLVYENNSFSCLYVDVEYLDRQALETIYKFAKQGLPVCLKQKPREPGYNKTEDYVDLIDEMLRLSNVSDDFQAIAPKKPIVEAADIPDFWCRKTDSLHYFFFANPKSQNVTFPIRYGQSMATDTVVQEVVLNLNDSEIPLRLEFCPYQSLLVAVDNNGKHRFVNIQFKPTQPEVLNPNEKVVEDVYADGILIREKTFINNELRKIWNWSIENNRRKNRIEFKNGTRIEWFDPFLQNDSLYTVSQQVVMWHSKWQMQYKGNVVEGLKDGIWEAWYPGGRSESVEFYQDGYQTNNYIVWKPNGDIEFKGRFLDGRLYKQNSNAPFVGSIYLEHERKINYCYVDSCILTLANGKKLNYPVMQIPLAGGDSISRNKILNINELKLVSPNGDSPKILENITITGFSISGRSHDGYKTIIVEGNRFTSAVRQLIKELSSGSHLIIENIKAKTNNGATIHIASHYIDRVY